MCLSGDEHGVLDLMRHRNLRVSGQPLVTIKRMAHYDRAGDTVRIGNVLERSFEMNNERFVSVIKLVVRDSAIKGVVDNLEHPPGRRPPAELLRQSEWFKQLDEAERQNVVGIVRDAVNHAVFGFLCVLDGVRIIEDGEDQGELLLIYRKDGDTLLNDFADVCLHDLYNESD